MEYLTRWRMLVAGDRLELSEESVLEIALSLGYESESAFGKAFRRVMGCSPRRYSHAGVLDASRDCPAKAEESPTEEALGVRSSSRIPADGPELPVVDP